MTMILKANNDSEIEYNEDPKPTQRPHINQNANRSNSCQKPTCTNNNAPIASSDISSSNNQPLQRFNDSILTMELHHHPEETASHHSSVPFEVQNNFIAQPSTPTPNQSRNLPKKRKLRVRRDHQCSKKKCANCKISESRLQYIEKKVEIIRKTNELIKKNIFLFNRRSAQLYNILVATGLTEQ